MSTPNKTELFDDLPTPAASTELRPVKGKAAPLSKAQSAFQRAKRQVEKMQHLLEHETSALGEALAFANKHLTPLKAEMMEQQKTFIRHVAPLLFQQDKSLSKRQTNDLTEIINYLLEKFRDSTSGLDEELSDIYKKTERFLYGDGKFDGPRVPKIVTEEEKNFVEEAKAGFEQAFASIGVKVDLSGFTPEMTEQEMDDYVAKLKDQFAEEMSEKAFREFSKFENSENPPPVSTRKKTQKQLEREAREKEIEDARTKNISSVYKQLARLFHPDLEPDPTKKAQREELMKELTAAYESGDLHTILNLELRWLQKEDGDISKMSDAKLDAYTAALKNQARDIREEINILYCNPLYAPLYSVPSFREHISFRLIYDLSGKVNEFSARIEALKSDIERVTAKNPFKFLRSFIAREAEGLRNIRAHQALPFDIADL